MKYLVFDTETSGLPDYAAPADDPCQPRLAQFTGHLLDEQLRTTDTLNYLVAPDGWEMTPEATAVNGLTTEHLREHGAPIADLLAWYTTTIHAGYVPVSFNVRHDCKIFRGELRRAGMDDLFAITPNICLMRASWAKEIGMVKADGSRRGWPKLSDACRHFEIPQSDEHTSPGDADAHLALFLKLHAGGYLPEASVHYAKDKPQPDKQVALPGMDF
jgi:DNA polymerase III epsilon subunit-like protein